jgi:hypothetical protein
MQILILDLNNCLFFIFLLMMLLELNVDADADAMHWREDQSARVSVQQ